MRLLYKYEGADYRTTMFLTIHIFRSLKFIDLSYTYIRFYHLFTSIFANWKMTPIPAARPITIYIYIGSVPSSRELLMG